MIQPPLRLTVLGPVRAWRGKEEIDLGGPKQRAILGILAVDAGRPVLRETIIDFLWPDGPPVSAVNLVQTYVKRLRRALEPGRASHSRLGPLQWVRGGYLLQVDPAQTDIGLFRTLVRQAPANEKAIRLLERAIGLWHGPPLSGTGSLDGLRRLAIRLERERLAASLTLADLYLASGEPAPAARLLESLADTVPYHEPLHARLLSAYCRAGRIAEALAAYEVIRARLRDDLGAAPGPELRHIHEALLDASSPRPAHARCHLARRRRGLRWAGGH